MSTQVSKNFLCVILVSLFLLAITVTTVHAQNSSLYRQELKDAKNVALVVVTTTIPAAGARQGDKINCSVSAIGAKSLRGGRLMMTPMLGPRPGNERIYGFAQGSIELDNEKSPATAVVHGGCWLEEDFFSVFVRDDNIITLVLNENHAGFQDVADMVNTQSQFLQGNETTRDYIAKAIDQVNIEVWIPSEEYVDDPVLFVSQILGQRILNLQTEARVVINERADTVVIGDDVEIGPVAVSHKNIIVDAGGGAAAGKFIPVDPGERATAKLTSLVAALNAVKVPTEDVIEIIKGLDRNGKLYGKLIIE